MIYWLAIEPNSGGAGYWSETTERRKPIKGSNRWDPTFGDCHPLGPIPKSEIEEMSNHWLLIDYLNDEPPITYNSILATHLSGLQPICESVANVFCKHAGGKCEKIEIPKIWSLSTASQATIRLFLANVFSSFETIDLNASGAMKVINPNIGAKYGVPKNPKTTKLLKNLNSASGIWRDSNTSDWFCDESFREDLESVAPGSYCFSKMSEH